MSDGTAIEWTDASWNPLRARLRTSRSQVGHHCEKVSEGCRNCYASRMQRRFGLPEFSGPSRREDVEYYLDQQVLEQPLHWKKPRRIFVCSMTDLFGGWVTDEQIDLCLATMALTPHHTHQLLTKRPERMLEYATQPNLRERIDDACGQFVDGCRFHGDLPLWPLPNVWLGVSVENQEAAGARIPHLLRTPAAVRFLSVEPMLSAVDLRAVRVGCGWDALDCACSGGPCDHAKVDWVIVGGESGHGARPCNLVWVRSLVKQCRAADVACFVKQLGSNYADPENGVCGKATVWPYDVLPTGPTRRLSDPKGGNIDEFPADLQVRQFPAHKETA